MRRQSPCQGKKHQSIAQGSLEANPGSCGTNEGVRLRKPTGATRLCAGGFGKKRVGTWSWEAHVFQGRTTEEPDGQWGMSTATQSPTQGSEAGLLSQPVVRDQDFQTGRLLKYHCFSRFQINLGAKVRSTMEQALSFQLDTHI